MISRRSFARGVVASFGIFRCGTGWSQIERPLRHADPSYKGSTEIYQIIDPGQYFLDRDIVQNKQYGGGHTGPTGTMLGIYCGSVELDLRQHVFGANFGMSGIGLSVRNNTEAARDFPEKYSSASLDSRFVKIINGVIDYARGDHTGRAVGFWHHWDETDICFKGRGGRDGNPPADIVYVRNDYRFEDLKILANEAALVVEGSHTVIRNCVIESAGTAAIFIAGPNVTIENCEIRLKNLVEGTYACNTPTRGAIVLRDGSGAVIRNNRIRVDYGGWPSETHCILLRDGAKDVLVEGNTFINVDGEPVTLTEGSQAVVRDNKRERRLWPL